jgi:hypothetical protein
LQSRNDGRPHVLKLFLINRNIYIDAYTLFFVKIQKRQDGKLVILAQAKSCYETNAKKTSATAGYERATCWLG